MAVKTHRPKDIAWVRLYNDTAANLLYTFREHKGYSQQDFISLTEKKEFTYWLFKRRVGAWDPARVASDTRKGSGLSATHTGVVSRLQMMLAGEG